jgi:hypothetical protein
VTDYSRLLSTTIVIASAGLALLSAPTVRAADLTLLTKAAPTPPPAVDGFNGKIDGFGGSIGNKSVYGAEGALSTPLAHPYGLQIDGRAGSFDGSSFGSIGGHLFWRDPTRALFGLYGDYTNWNRFGGVRVAHVAGEGAYFFGQLTLEGIAGIEFGNTASSSSIVGVSNSTSSSTSQSTTTIPEVFPTPGETIVTTTTVTASTTTITTLTEAYSIKTRYFDQINLAYYPIDNWKVFVGHRYLGGLNAAALGSEYALPLGRGIMSSAFVEARIGERDFHGIWGGLKLYFGQSDKPLIARQRRDDPPIWSGDALFSIINNHTTNVGTTSTQATTSTSSQTSTPFCALTEILVGSICESLD